MRHRGWCWPRGGLASTVRQTALPGSLGDSGSVRERASEPSSLRLDRGVVTCNQLPVAIGHLHPGIGPAQMPTPATDSPVLLSIRVDSGTVCGEPNVQENTHSTNGSHHFAANAAAVKWNEPIRSAPPQPNAGFKRRCRTVSPNTKTRTQKSNAKN